MLLKLTSTLASTLSTHLEMSKSRLETMATFIVLVMNVRTVNLTHIAAQFSQTAKPSSSYRRLQRFFQFFELDEDWLARAVVRLLHLNPPWILCFDRTNWQIGKSPVNILMLAIVTRRVRIPLMWTMLDKKGTSNTEERMALMQRYLDIFGAESIKCFLADREFIGPEWVEFLLNNNVLFAIRVKQKMYVTLENGHTHPLQNLLRKRGAHKQLTRYKARFRTMEPRTGFPLRFASKKLKNGELLIIVTNMPHPMQALAIYKKRWFIECLFADTKTHGLNIEDTRMTNLKKLSLLISLMTLAMAWAYVCAKKVMGTKNIPKAPHGYLRKSWFRTGFDTLRNWIFNQPQKAEKLWKKMWPKRKSTLQKASVV